MKTLYFIPTGEPVQLIKDFGNRARVMFPDGEVRTESRENLAEQVEIVGVPQGDAIRAELVSRDKPRGSPELSDLPLFGIEMNASEPVNMFENLPEDDPEKKLREMYTAQGIPEKKQNEIVAEITAKAKPEYLENLFPSKDRFIHDHFVFCTVKGV